MRSNGRPTARAADRRAALRPGDHRAGRCRRLERHGSDAGQSGERRRSDIMKVSIIGGGGLVGSCAAFALQCGGDRQPHRPDRRQRRPLPGPGARPAPRRLARRPTSGSARPATRRSPRATSSCITAGLRRKPDESRLDLINRNVELFLDILDQVKSAGPEDGRDRPRRLQSGRRADLSGGEAARACPPAQVIGLGTQLDTARFRSLIAEALKLPPTQVRPLILGEHGDSMVPIWSAAQAAGLPLEQFPGWTPAPADALFERTRGSGAEVIKLKGGAGSRSACRSARSSTRSRSTEADPAGSSLVSGDLGIRDVCLSVPTVVGPQGRRASSRSSSGPRRSRRLQHRPGAPRDDRPGPQEESQGQPASRGAAVEAGGRARKPPERRPARPGHDGRRRRQRRDGSPG